MPHENSSSAGANDEDVFQLVPPLSPELSAKLKAKSLSSRRIAKVHNAAITCILIMIAFLCVVLS